MDWTSVVSRRSFGQIIRRETGPVCHRSSVYAYSVLLHAVYPVYVFACGRFIDLAFGYR